MRVIALYAGPVLAVAAAMWAFAGGFDQSVAVVLAVAVVCIVWWIFEPIAIPVTSLIPLGVLPLAGVLTPAEVGEA